MSVSLIANAARSNASRLLLTATIAVALAAGAAAVSASSAEAKPAAAKAKSQRANRAATPPPVTKRVARKPKATHGRVSGRKVG